MFNYIKNETPYYDYISNSISLNSDTHNHYTRTRNNLIIPRYSLAASQTSFIYQAVRVWNSLSNELKSSDSIKKFEAKLEVFLYS